MKRNPIHWSPIVGLALLTVLSLLTSSCRLDLGSPEATPPDPARSLIEATGVRGGVVVVVGCGDPALLARLRTSGPYLVHCLDKDPGKVARARRDLQERTLYGPVSVSQLVDARLPYVDDLVNLIVLTEEFQIPGAEMTRVLSPGGVIADMRKPRVEITRKERSGELDEWTHFLYNSSNNPVSSDTVVGPPRGLRWTSGPRYGRSHEHLAGVSALVAAGGRIFTIFDAGPIGSVYLPAEWKLTARDAFNGVLLWEHPIEHWESQLRGFRSGPPEIGRRIVASDDRVYAALDYGSLVTVFDAATGQELNTLSGTDGARELLLTGGVLYVLADDMTTTQHDERRDWISRTAETKEYRWPYPLPHAALDMYGTQRVLAVAAETGERLWEKGFDAPGEVMPTTLAADDGRVCLQTVSEVLCLDASRGEELWRRPRPVATRRWSWSAPTLVIHDGVVLTVDRLAAANAAGPPAAQGSVWMAARGTGGGLKQEGEIVAFSLDDGKELWRAPCFENYHVPQDIFVINGVVWVGDLRWHNDPGFTQGRDLRTGRIVAAIPRQTRYGHHRCHRNKATLRWLLVSRQGDGIGFIDPRNGTNKRHGWVRGPCQYGIMPANGLVYAPQHSCACSPEELLIGFNVLSPRSSAGEGPKALEKGSAYGDVPDTRTGSSDTEWPTYRGDAGRSGYQDLSAPDKVNLTWAERLSPPITAPVVADGMVLVAETDRHTLHALSAVAGERIWAFVADGRIDSPPTLFGGLCLFGTRGGFVYCLRASDGELVWRFRAAQQDRRLLAYEQLESVWPVHGSVLVDETASGGPARAYFAAGRSARIDGGIRLYALSAVTGEVLHTADVDMSAGADGDGIIRERALPDILSLQRDTIWMRQLGVDRNLAPSKRQSHLYAARGFLDDAWWHRTHWVYGSTVLGGFSAWPVVGNVAPVGRLLTYDDGGFIYGYGRNAFRALSAGHVRQDAGGYMLFAEALGPEPAPGTERSWLQGIFTRHRNDLMDDPKVSKRDIEELTYDAIRRDFRERRRIWNVQLPFVARSMVLSRDALLVAGGESLTESAEHHGPGTFWIVSREDGSKRATCDLPAPPVLDGMALTDAGIFISAIDGSLLRISGAD